MVSQAPLLHHRPRAPAHSRRTAAPPMAPSNRRAHATIRSPPCSSRCSSSLPWSVRPRPTSHRRPRPSRSRAPPHPSSRRPIPSPPPPDARRRPRAHRRATAAPPTAEPTAEPDRRPDPRSRPTRPRPPPRPTAPSPEPTPSRAPRGAVRAPPASVEPRRRSHRPLPGHAQAPAPTPPPSSAGIGRARAPRADRTFQRAFRGFAARLDKASSGPPCSPTRTSSPIVPDEKIELTAQTIPTGVSRVGDQGQPDRRDRQRRRARRRRHRDRRHRRRQGRGPERRRATDCSSGNAVDRPARAATSRATARMSPAPPPRSTTTSAWSAWPPAPGSGASASSTTAARACCRGTSAASTGSSTSATRTTRADRCSRSVNMSVTKWGKDDGACGTENNDILHAGHLPARQRRHHRRGRGGQRLGLGRRPACRRRTTRSSPCRPSPTPTASPAPHGGNRCYSWGGYDSDDTFANFSNYGRDVDIMAPGKCIWSTLRTGSYGVHERHEHGLADRRRRRRPVQGQPPDGDPRRRQGRPPAPGQPGLQDLDRSGRQPGQAARRQPARHARLVRLPGVESPPCRSPTAAARPPLPVTITRSSTHFERVRFKVERPALRLDRDLGAEQPHRLLGQRRRPST